MWPYPKIVTHRGGGTLAPENTLAALHYAHAHGFRAVEFDAMLAADQVPVLMHDAQFGRTVAGPGSVPGLGSAQLRLRDAGAWFGPDHAGEPVPLLAEALEFCRRNGVWMNVEIKPAPGHERATGRIVAATVAAAFAGAPADERPLLSSFSLDALEAARFTAPELARGLLVGAVGPHWPVQLRAVGATALHVDQARLTAAQAHAVKAAGVGLFCYTVNDPQRARMLLEWGVDAFCTDRLDLISPAFA